MSFFNPETGVFCFSDGYTLEPLQLREATDGIVSLGLHPVEGGSMKVLARIAEEGESYIWLLPFPDLPRPVTWAQQFAFLLSSLRLRLPDSAELSSFQVQFPFGTLYLILNTLTGVSEAMFCFSRETAVKGGDSCEC